MLENSKVEISKMMDYLFVFKRNLLLLICNILSCQFDFETKRESENDIRKTKFKQSMSNKQYHIGTKTVSPFLVQCFFV